MYVYDIFDPCMYIHYRSKVWNTVDFLMFLQSFLLYQLPNNTFWISVV